MLDVGLDCRLHLVDFHVDDSHLHVDACDLGMILTYASAINIERAMQILESFRIVPAVVVVHCQSRVVVTYLGVLDAQKPLLQHYGFCL